ncbi:MAG: cobyric acid synthase [Methanocalculus sp. MSAO_Arc1]|uniref:cobyric acid synthase n=1 Tax=Methanocalculus TaxID=71151 RepID=UPI000FF1F5C1|nr:MULTISPECIES: cobyric acid synthase [unclassified Methanocalculus]MCP1662032.1 adenosylcobyric acid synthase [Methanocalculus sp. AMF5]RQD79602.1 MAG: cobyric acid synthase [Methanocalculus sp. MSAO_Arc1]
MSLLVLGTASHVGKSVTVAGLCRALLNRGYAVTPFKAQNMSLNSYVTADGLEIGIAQAMQAIAAGQVATADMNPILLKPKADSVSQVIVLGKPYRDLPIREYYKETENLLEVAVSAYERLFQETGCVLCEGAGGAAELNLYERDIANIRLARRLGIPIVLVADIERGGVFAQLYGTIELLPPDIRALVSGIIINKFRGDKEIFATGVTLIEEYCNVPVLGVVPACDLTIPSEDSLSLQDKRASSSPVRIAVIHLPRIANYTDFETLERNASVTYVRPGESLKHYDCIIIPGTKNTVLDLLHLREHGTISEIEEARDRGIPVIGICGGFQMLGRTIHDNCIESTDVASYEGIGFLPVETWFSEYAKTTIRVTRKAEPIGPILGAMDTVSGYEIHMGRSERIGGREAFSGDGAVSDDGLVFGTYLHALFSNQSAVSALLTYLYRTKGLEFTMAAECDPYDQFAEHLEAHIDMDRIIQLASPRQRVS